MHLYQLDITVKQARDKVRELFVKNAHVTDPRVIDMLVIKVRAGRLGPRGCREREGGGRAGGERRGAVLSLLALTRCRPLQSGLVYPL